MRRNWVTTLLADEMSYVAGEALPDGAPVEAKIRYRAPWCPPTCSRSWATGASSIRPTLADITPGQAVSFTGATRYWAAGSSSAL